MSIKSPLDEQARKVTGEALQGALVDLIDLSLVAKQAHWTLVGRRFRPVHLQLDEVVDLARQHTDVIAERLATIAVPPDGRGATIAAETRLDQFEPGWVEDHMAVSVLVEILGGVVARLRARIAVTETSDQVSQDLLIATNADLEKQWWMWQAQTG